MADITMCRGDGCPLKEKCYRYKAHQSNWQSYFVEVPYNGKDCEKFWEIEND